MIGPPVDVSGGDPRTEYARLRLAALERLTSCGLPPFKLMSNGALQVVPNLYGMVGVVKCATTILRASGFTVSHDERAPASLWVERKCATDRPVTLITKGT